MSWITYSNQSTKPGTKHLEKDKNRQNSLFFPKDLHTPYHLKQSTKCQLISIAIGGVLVVAANAAPAAAFPTTPNGIFGSLEIATNQVSGSKQWSRVIEQIDRETALYTACDKGAASCPREVRAWRHSMQQMREFGGRKLLAAVNSRVNQLIKYRDDIDTFGRMDHWASPAEALTRRGDCEDYAILKYASLRELGVAAEDMRIVVVNDTRRRRGHAVLSVDMGGKTYILDSLQRAPKLHSNVRGYVPHYSINAQGQWLNFPTRKRGSKVAYRKTIKVKLPSKVVLAKPKPDRVARAQSSLLRGAIVDPVNSLN